MYCTIMYCTVMTIAHFSCNILANFLHRPPQLCPEICFTYVDQCLSHAVPHLCLLFGYGNAHIKKKKKWATCPTGGGVAWLNHNLLSRFVTAIAEAAKNVKTTITSAKGTPSHQGGGVRPTWAVGPNMDVLLK